MALSGQAATFDLSGTLTDGSLLGGSLQIDATLGTILSSNLSSSTPSAFSFTQIVGQGANAFGFPNYGAGIRNAAHTEDLNFIVLGVDTLIGFTGGALFGSLFDLTSGTVGPQLVSAELTATRSRPLSHYSLPASAQWDCLAGAGTGRRKRPPPDPAKNHGKYGGPPRVPPRGGLSYSATGMSAIVPRVTVAATPPTRSPTDVDRPFP
jgi:hypothetical protein